MQIKRQKAKLKLKQCKYLGCNVEFFGHPISKYCKFHSNIKNRINKKQQIKRDNNRIIDHDDSEIFKLKLKCLLENCNNHYEIEILPKLYVYPAYCFEHRNEFKRKNFIDNNKNKKFFELKPLIKDLKKPNNVIFKENKIFVLLNNKSNRMVIRKNIVQVTKKNYQDFENIPDEIRKKRHMGRLHAEKNVTSLEEFKEILFDYFKKEND